MKTHMLFVCIILLTFGFVFSNPVIFEYESISDDEFATNISSEFDDDISYLSYPVEVIQRKKRDVLKDFDDDNNNTSFLSITTTTTTNAEPVVNLSDVIRRIETAFINSAANIIQALKNLTLETNSNKNIEKRGISSETPNDFMTSTQNETTEIDISTEPITSTVHVPVAKIAIYPNVGYFPMIPTFDYNLNKKNDDDDDDDDIQLPDTEKSTKLKRSLLETINGTENLPIKATTIKTEKSTSSSSSSMIVQDPTIQHKNIEDEM